MVPSSYSRNNQIVTAKEEHNGTRGNSPTPARYPVYSRMPLDSSPAGEISSMLRNSQKGELSVKLTPSGSTSDHRVITVTEREWTRVVWLYLGWWTFHFKRLQVMIEQLDTR